MKDTEKTDLLYTENKEKTTITFQTPIALKVLGIQPKEFIDKSYGDENSRTIDIQAGQFNQMLSFAISHNLSISKTD